MDDIAEAVHVKSVEGSAGSVVDVEQIESVELGNVSNVGMVVDSVEQDQMLKKVGRL